MDPDDWLTQTPSSDSLTDSYDVVSRPSDDDISSIEDMEIQSVLSLASSTVEDINDEDDGDDIISSTIIHSGRWTHSSSDSMDTTIPGPANSSRPIVPLSLSSFTTSLLLDAEIARKVNSKKECGSSSSPMANSNSTLKMPMAYRSEELEKSASNFSKEEGLSCVKAEEFLERLYSVSEDIKLSDMDITCISEVGLVAKWVDKVRNMLMTSRYNHNKDLHLLGFGQDMDSVMLILDRVNLLMQLYTFGEMDPRNFYVERKVDSNIKSDYMIYKLPHASEASGAINHYCCPRVPCELDFKNINAIAVVYYQTVSEQKVASPRWILDLLADSDIPVLPICDRLLNSVDSYPESDIISSMCAPHVIQSIDDRNLIVPITEDMLYSLDANHVLSPKFCEMFVPRLTSSRQPRLLRQSNLDNELGIIAERRAANKLPSKKCRYSFFLNSHFSQKKRSYIMTVKLLSALTVLFILSSFFSGTKNLTISQEDATIAVKPPSSANSHISSDCANTQIRSLTNIPNIYYTDGKSSGSVIVRDEWPSSLKAISTTTTTKPRAIVKASSETRNDIELKTKQEFIEVDWIDVVSTTKNLFRPISLLSLRISDINLNYSFVSFYGHELDSLIRRAKHGANNIVNKNMKSYLIAANNMTRMLLSDVNLRMHENLNTTTEALLSLLISKRANLARDRLSDIANKTALSLVKNYSELHESMIKMMVFWMKRVAEKSQSTVALAYEKQSQILQFMKSRFDVTINDSFQRFLQAKSNWQAKSKNRTKSNDRTRPNGQTKSNSRNKLNDRTNTNDKVKSNIQQSIQTYLDKGLQKISSLNFTRSWNISLHLTSVNDDGSKLNNSHGQSHCRSDNRKKHSKKNCFWKFNVSYTG